VVGFASSQISGQMYAIHKFPPLNYLYEGSVQQNPFKQAWISLVAQF
jgi:hypothetical protein